MTFPNHYFQMTIPKIDATLAPPSAELHIAHQETHKISSKITDARPNNVFFLLYLNIT